MGRAQTAEKASFRARRLIENVGDPVVYRNVKWYYLRSMTEAVKRAVKLLEEARELKRWSEKTRDVIRFIE
jgi:hypothetical protein